MTRARDIADLAKNANDRLDTVATSDGALSNRNLIINGAMQVAQRGTSHTGQGYGSIDRMVHNLSGGISTMSQEAFATGSEVEGFKYYLKMDVTTNSDFTALIHKVEDVRSLPQGKATLSFYAKGTNPNGGSLNVNMQILPDGNTTFATPLDDSCVLTSTWQRFIFTFDMPSLAGMTGETASSHLYVRIGSATDASTNAWELNITGLMLERGDTATPFEHRSYGDELARCQRYYSVIDGFGMGGYVSNIDLHAPVKFPVEMRADPTATLITGATKQGSTFTVNVEGTSGGRMSIARGAFSQLYAFDNTIKLDAEL